MRLLWKPELPREAELHVPTPALLSLSFLGSSTHMCRLSRPQLRPWLPVCRIPIQISTLAPGGSFSYR